ncbi:GNAT family N-acetyltransferase [Candidatus Dependentiae bacterium]|nr:GNAT family N-acetyltransferase [Candidatus Dependentiae bacterium]
MKCETCSGDLVTIASLKERDIATYLEELSDVVRHTLYISSKQTKKECLESSKVDVQENGAICVYAILENKTKKLIGAIEIRPMYQFKGQLYVWLNEQYWGEGYFKEAIDLITQMYFENVLETFCTAHVDVMNVRSYKAFKKAGFADKEIYDGPYGKQYVLVYKRIS